MELFEFLPDTVEFGGIGVDKLIYPGIHGKKKHRRVHAFAKPRMASKEPPTQQQVENEQKKRREKQMPRRRQCVHPAAGAARGGSAGLNTLFDIRSEKGRIIHGWHGGLIPLAVARALPDRHGEKNGHKPCDGKADLSNPQFGHHPAHLGGH